MTQQVRNPFFEKLKKGLEQGIAHARGEITLKTIEHPEDPPEVPSETLVELRKAAGMSQGVFAKVLSTSVRTIQSWEQGKREPSMPTRRLIQVLATEPETLSRIVGISIVKFRGFHIEKLPNGRRLLLKVATPKPTKAAQRQQN